MNSISPGYSFTHIKITYTYGQDEIGEIRKYQVVTRNTAACVLAPYQAVIQGFHWHSSHHPVEC